MKKIVASILLIVSISMYAQTISVVGYVSGLKLDDCSDCSGGADPRISARIGPQFSPWSAEYKNEADNVGCSSTLTSNPGFYFDSGVGIDETWWVDIRGYEDDDGF